MGKLERIGNIPSHDSYLRREKEREQLEQLKKDYDALAECAKEMAEEIYLEHADGYFCPQHVDEKYTCRCGLADREKIMQKYKALMGEKK